VVTRGHESIFLRCMGGIVNRFPLGQFDVVVLCAASSITTMQQILQHPDVSVTVLPESFPAAVATIQAAACGLLYYWEVGSDALNYFLPFLRLAPVQCTSWSTLVTSGVPNVDYYLSSALVEDRGETCETGIGTDRPDRCQSPFGDDADAHYSERLIRLRSLLSCQPRQTLPEPRRDRAHFGLPADYTLYVCPQNLLKIHPDFDDLAARILRADPNGLLVLKHGRWPRTGQRLLERFRRTLADVLDRVVLLPWLSHDDYLHLVALADVVLDTPHYGAGSTNYDIFSFNQPLVTLPGRFNIGRYTLACYRRMGLTDLIAESPDHYVQLAVRVGTDPDFRQFVTARIGERSVALFDDRAAVDEHVRFFAEAVR
jgi:protein O-GlcNAc transferase